MRRDPIQREIDRIERAEAREGRARDAGNARAAAFWGMIADGAWIRMVRTAEDTGLTRALPPQITFERRKR